ncbi:MAG: neurogenic locus notch protein 1-like [Pedosphaera sp.]|nr:neurogenic locus notch protein 1-like [Pedosphaera sp.]
MTFETVIKNFTTRGLRIEDITRYLDAGNDIHHRDTKMGWTLLHFAAEDCNPDAIRLLITRGADPNIKENTGRTPLHFAVDSDLDTSIQAGRRATDMPTTRALIELGADESARTTDNATPRDIAVNYGAATLYDSLFRHPAA